ncbi:copper chaperone CopZ [Lutibacter oceani]|uniref:Copper chaperone CopZ n=1 Tax=Lutibacter oceani TaxID=1853311 RepID=A0A3D9RLE8_9FLAO|nr:heavy metal-associated domain-containing protein [Lutibacter oceani]REE80709.1 copper chaperone CopZ [Lutibacter oceani]
MTTTLEILNLKCGGCANSIKKGLLSIEGVSEVSVDLETSVVTVNAKDDSVLTNVKNKLATMGYPEVGDANTIIHKAKSFVSCATGRMTSETE